MDNKLAKTQAIIDSLDKDKIHILYFKKDLSLRNIYHNPLLLIIRIYNCFSQRIKVDHVAHISRFIWNQEDNKFEAKIFEATIERGMEQNDLIDKIKNYHGTVLIETLNKKVCKKKAKLFEIKYTGVSYSKLGALLSDFDGIFDKLKIKDNGGFCSWLEAIFLMTQGISIDHIQKGNPREITPTDLYNADFEIKRILYKS